MATREDEAGNAEARDEPEHDNDPVAESGTPIVTRRRRGQRRGSRLAGAGVLPEEQGRAHGGDDRIREVEQRHECDGRTRVALEEPVGDAELEDAERGRHESKSSSGESVAARQRQQGERRPGDGEAQEQQRVGSPPAS